MKYNMYQELVDRINFYIYIIDKIPTKMIFLLTKSEYTKEEDVRNFWKKELEKRGNLK